ncbi:4-alpha-glucanotransferase [Entamoeba marina]
MKGDLPIGVSKRSVECWMYPQYFRLNKSTGAPPDYFSAGEGQNWGFPTYDWENMDKDGYLWWRGRLSHMSQYFNSYRIDHILGFFRIWEIPAEHRTGLLGRFKPDLPLSRQELESYGIYDTDRLTYPYIRDHTLDHLFGDEKTFVISKFLVNNYNGTYNFKPEFQSEGAILEQTGLSPNERLADRKIISGLKLLLQNVCLMRSEDPNMFYPRIDIEKTYSSFAELDFWVQEGLRKMYRDYFYKRHEGLWEYTARRRLPAMAKASDMLVCGEDLGMVPDCVVRVMNDMKINCLRVQRLTDNPDTVFYHPADYQYLTVCAPSGHDMSTIRGWWEEDRGKTQFFWNNLLGRGGAAPFTCPPEVVKTIFDMHLYSPAMLACFPLQDILSLKQRYIEGRDPKIEQINDPSNPIHYWRYRCHVDMDDIMADNDLNSEVRNAVYDSGRHIF